MKAVWGILVVSVVALSALTMGEPGTPNDSPPEQVEFASDQTSFVVDDAISAPCLDAGSMISQARIPDELDIRIPDARGWSRNLFEAITSPYDWIGEEYKADYDASVAIHYSDGPTCQSQAEVRISGDLKDHLAWESYQSPVSSLDVTLEDESIDGVVRFKLFLPGTRPDRWEILMTEVMRMSDIIAPRTFELPVNINGQEVTYLFQEKLSKELVERSYRRESALIESDEDLFWNGPLLGTEESIFARSINGSWAQRGPSSLDITERGVQTLVRALSPTWKPQVALSDGSIVPNLIPTSLLAASSDKDLSSAGAFEALMLATGSWHGLRPHNRKFYFDPVSGDLLPVYYDGGPNGFWGLQAAGPDGVLEHLRDSGSALTSREAATLVESLDGVASPAFRSRLSTLGASFEPEELAEWHRSVVGNIELLVQDTPSKGEISSAESAHAIFPTKSVTLAFSKAFPEVTLCEVGADCRNRVLTSTEIHELLNGSLVLNEVPVKLAGTAFSAYSAGIDAGKPRGSLELQTTLNETEVLASGPVDVEVGPGHELLIIAHNASTRVLMRGGTISGWSITGRWPEESNPPTGQRFDENLLTSCLTLLDVDLMDTEIETSGGGCEDSLNFMRVTGDVSSIEIERAYQDGLDIDFSTVNIQSIKIRDTGNDCLDLSSGTYTIGIASLTGCSDKAVSVGEKADAEFSDLVIDRSTLGVAVKDSSQVTVENLQIGNTETCAAVYRKKQEFGGASLSLPQDACATDQVAVQPGSRLEYLSATPN